MMCPGFLKPYSPSLKTLAPQSVNLVSPKYDKLVEGLGLGPARTC